MAEAALDPVAHLYGKTVVVTGGAGSIGSELCKRVLEANAATLRIVSLTESGLYNACKQLEKLRKDTTLVPILGSVTNSTLMHDVTKGADIVVHAAAHKHVPICERNPLEAMFNNIVGTQRIAWAAKANNVAQFLLVSTDKAVRPQSVMGRTKRVAEILVSLLGPGFVTVRFGNVRDSAGSVLPLWREQLRNGEPVTVTDMNCTRYFMTISEACGLILSVLAMQARQGVFVFDMGEPIQIATLLEDLVMSMGLTSFEVKEIGLRPGEKLHEELHYDGQLFPTQHPKIFRIAESFDVPTARALLIDLISAVRCNTEGLALQLLEKIAT